MPDVSEHICSGCCWGYSCNADNSLYFCMMPKCAVKSKETKAAIVAAVTYKKRKKLIEWKYSED